MQRFESKNRFGFFSYGLLKSAFGKFPGLSRNGNLYRVLPLPLPTNPQSLQNNIFKVFRIFHMSRCLQCIPVVEWNLQLSSLFIEGFALNSRCLFFQTTGSLSFFAF